MPLPRSWRTGPPCHLLVGSVAAEPSPVGLFNAKGGGGGDGEETGHLGPPGGSVEEADGATCTAGEI